MKGKLLNIAFAISIVSFLILIGNFIYHGFQPDKTTFFGFKNVYVVSQSMEPTIMKNALCITRTIDFSEIEVGDIITYSHDNQIIIHRVKEKHSDYLITKGDNNDVQDPWKAYPDVVRGKVVCIMNWIANI